MNAEQLVSAPYLARRRRYLILIGNRWVSFSVLSRRSGKGIRPSSQDTRSHDHRIAVRSETIIASLHVLFTLQHSAFDTLAIYRAIKIGGHFL